MQLKMKAERHKVTDLLQQLPTALYLQNISSLASQLVASIHGQDMLEADSTKVFSSPSVRHGNLQCTKRNY